MWTQNIFLQLHEDLGSDSYITREHTTDTYITGAILVPSDRRWQGELAEGRIARNFDGTRPDVGYGQIDEVAVMRHWR